MFKGRHFDQSVILLCVRWYLAYNLSLRDLEEMMAERGLKVDHSTVHRWVAHFSPQLLERFNRRKRTVGSKWRMDETYIRVCGQWMYLYRAIDSLGDTVEFFFSENRDLVVAKRFLRKALARHGRPERIVIDGSQTNHGAIKRRIRSMLGFKSQPSAVVILSGIEMIHMKRKRQARYAYNPSPSIAEQFDILAA
ncbi:IS6 family transposase (plasmid) [Mesorhizobium loti]|nr:IS6 family transposase [Mesorhizobium loti]